MNNFKDIVSFLPSDFVEDILTEYDLNDPAHLRQHAIDVVCHADEIIRKFPDQLEALRLPIIIGALIHDIKCHVNRDLHHILGALCIEKMLFDYNILVVVENLEDFRKLEEGECITQLSWSEVNAIKAAVLEHRASWTHARSNTISDVVAAADRGKPDMYKYIRRAVLFRVAQVDESSLPLTDIMKQRIVAESITHIKEKFGVGGYAYKTLPNHTKRMYHKEILDMQVMLAVRTDELATYALSNFDKWVGVCKN